MGGEKSGKIGCGSFSAMDRKKRARFWIAQQECWVLNTTSEHCAAGQGRAHMRDPSRRLRRVEVGEEAAGRRSGMKAGSPRDGGEILAWDEWWVSHRCGSG